ncbi:2Fe-2S iron-sulfur cluster-binding protein [Hyphomonas sp.]|uniref:2Fe-2S iron-sulfur cluster-binding protein n=1 Tax=Hyphomonas sp. TaxID=87 RepID=UPI0025C1FB5D|nr:2Fe-2S iron-sulfur cluster-binding protein [Hyphomonas sp.]
MSKFYNLTVVGVEHTTRDAVVVSLKPNPDCGEAFKFLAGQHLTFRREINGEELRRSYSICSRAGEGLLRIGIKRVDDGWFSTWANESIKLGDTIEAMPPAGRFTVPLDSQASRHYLGLAVGSGITPILSLVSTILAQEPSSRFTLIYGNRSINSIMFREELEDLKNRYMHRLRLVHVLKNDGGDIELFNGRLDREKCEALFDRWVDVSLMDYVFICGPQSMTAMAKELLAGRGLSPDQIKYEFFLSSPRASFDPDAVASPQAQLEKDIEVIVTLDGTTRTTTSSKGLSILDGLLENALDAPYSCKAGVCSTCRCKVLEGEVEMIANHGLEDYEVERGFVLSCQSYAVSDRVVIDYDH